MSYTKILKHMGFNDKDRIVIFNADDFGMSESSISAVEDLADVGILSSASIMPTCPWFMAAAKWSSNNPDFSVGVHLSLTSEWPDYRWSSCCRAPRVSGLIDDFGYLHQKRQTVLDKADPYWVGIELKAQIDLVQSTGIDISHLDAHMYTALLIPFLHHYLQLAHDYSIPAVLWSFDQRPHFGYEKKALNQAQTLLKKWVANNQAYLLDKQMWTRMCPPITTLESVKKQLLELQTGLTRFYIHPAKDTPELRRILPDWQCRVADYEVFSNQELLKFIKKQNIHILSYLEVKKAINELAI